MFFTQSMHASYFLDMVAKLEPIKYWLSSSKLSQHDSMRLFEVLYEFFMTFSS